MVPRNGDSSVNRDEGYGADDGVAYAHGYQSSFVTYAIQEATHNIRVCYATDTSTCVHEPCSNASVSDYKHVQKYQSGKRQNEPFSDEPFEKNSAAR